MKRVQKNVGKIETNIYKTHYISNLYKDLEWRSATPAATSVGLACSCADFLLPPLLLAPSALAFLGTGWVWVWVWVQVEGKLHSL